MLSPTPLARLAALALALLLLATAASAAPLASKTWNGSQNAIWHNAANWTPLGIPAPGDDVTVPNGPAFMPQISSAGVSLGSLNIASGASLQIWGQPVSLSGSLTLSGQLQSMLGGALFEVNGNFTATGINAQFSNPGQTNLIGTGTLGVSSGATTSTLRITGGTRTLTSSVVPELHLIGGTALVANAATFTVSNLLRLEGGTLSFDTIAASTDTLRVNGDVEVVGTVSGTSSAQSRFRVAGNWTGTGTFVMANGWVELDTGGPSTIGGAQPTFGNLRINSDVVTLQAPTVVTGNLDVAVNGRLDVQNFPLSVTGDCVSSSAVGGIDGTATIVLNGTGLLAVNASTDPAFFQQSGTRTLSNAIVSKLTIAGGTVHIANGTNNRVVGDLVMDAGILSFDTIAASADILEVDGDLLANGTQVGSTSNQSRINVDGNWYANAPFVLPSGDVYVRGATPKIGGTQPAFKRLFLQGGPVELLSDVEISGTVNASTGGTFGAGYLELIGTTAAVTSGATTFERLRVKSGVNDLSTTRVDEFELSGGKARLLNGVALTVDVEARLLGGVFDFDTIAASTDLFDVNGDFYVNGTAVGTTSGQTRLRVAGDWTTETPFVLPNGWVEFDGDGASVGGAARVFHRLNLLTGDRVLPQDIQITGTLTRNSGTVSGPGWVEFIGSSGESVSLGGFTVPLVRIVDGAVQMPTIDIGELELLGGSLNVLNGSHVRVQGDADLFGGTLNWDTIAASTDIFEVFGDLEIDGTLVGTTSAQTLLRVSGDLALETPFVLPSGWVELRGGASTITGAVRDFARLSLVLGDCVLPEDIYISRALRRTSGTLSGPGYVEFVDDTVETVSLSGTLVPRMRVSNGTVVVGTNQVDEFELTGGTLHLANGANFEVQTEARLSGGSLSFDTTTASLDTFTVLGDLVETGTTVSQAATPTRLRVHGDYESDTGLDVGPGTTELRGTSQVVRGLDPVFHNLTILGPVVTFESSATVKNNLTVSSGSTTGPEWIEMVGDGSVSSGSNLVDKLRIFAENAAIATSRINELEIVDGRMSIPNAATVTVESKARLIGGELAFDTTSVSLDVLDCNGDFEQIGTVCVASSSSTRIRCAGDWRSNSSFGLASGAVELDGFGVSEVRGSLPGFDPVLPSVVVSNGIRELAGSPHVTVTALTVNGTARLRSISDPTIVGGAVAVHGTLDVEPGASLAVDGSAPITVHGAGRLELVGAPGAPAVLRGVSNDLVVSVFGTVAARDFEVRQPVASGFLFNAGSGLAPAPEDMRGGLFSEPAPAPGSTLLDVRFNGAKTFQFIRFDDPLGVGTFNVSRTSGAPIAFQNFGGNFAGAGFEHDPAGNLIDWLPTTVTQLVDFEVKPGPEAVMVGFETSVEVDVAWFHLQAAASAAGPFTTVQTFAPLGVGTYAFTEPGLAAGVPRFYRLIEEQTSGFELVLADGSATPYSAATPANVRTVGPGGEFATIQAAIDAASHARTVVRVAPGTYPSFVIDAPGALDLHIVGEGAVTIDAAAGPVVVSNVAAGQVVELSGLTLLGGPVGALGLLANAGAVLIDDVDVVTAGPGSLVADSAIVNLTRSSFTGTPSLRVSGATKAWAGATSIDQLEVLSGVQWQTCGLTTVAEALDPGAAVTAFPGVMPTLEVPAFVSLCQPFNVDIAAAPNSFFQLGAAGGALPLDLGNPATFQMLPVLDPFGYQVFASGFVGPGGTASLGFELPPDASLLGGRFVAQAWSVAVSSGLEVRFSNSSTVVGMP